MKRTFLAGIAISTCLFSQSTITCDVAAGYFNHATSRDQPSFAGPTLGLGVRQEYERGIARIGFSKATSVTGYSSATVAAVSNFYAISAGYSWKLGDNFCLGAGGRYCEYRIISPGPQQYSIMTNLTYGKNSTTLPEIACEWVLGRHFRIGLNVSGVQNFIEIRGVI